PFPIFAKRHGSIRPSRRFFIPCLFPFLPKGTVVFANSPIFYTVPFPLFPKRHGSVHHSNQNHVKPRCRRAPSLIPRLVAKRRNSPCGILFYQNNRPAAFFFIKIIALGVHFIKKNCADAFIVLSNQLR
ncbi:hypothetical protein, partial [uncultured Levyella sp.]|uniref:hypothetical protein n=1 Tax=uncultured Levyella sp. TaxID=1715800 RepID=UPI002585FBA5